MEYLKWKKSYYEYLNLERSHLNKIIERIWYTITLIEGVSQNDATKC